MTRLVVRQFEIFTLLFSCTVSRFADTLRVLY